MTTTTTTTSSPCSSVVSMGASGAARSLLLKLDYKEILAALADQGSLYIGDGVKDHAAPAGADAVLLLGHDLFDALPQRSQLARRGPRWLRLSPACLMAAREARAWRCVGAGDSKVVQLVLGDRACDGGSGGSDNTNFDCSDDEELRMTDAERRTLRRKIQELMDCGVLLRPPATGVGLAGGVT
ncbi:hypothetical protein ACP70R_001637 [Stipagrostis hirtigluma subsp. patula]